MTKKNKHLPTNLVVSERLKRLLEKARNHKMSPEEREEQRRSFARGNFAIDESDYSSVTQEGVDRAADLLNSKVEQER